VIHTGGFPLSRADECRGQVADLKEIHAWLRVVVRVETRTLDVTKQDVRLRLRHPRFPDLPVLGTEPTERTMEAR